jgi:carbamate kinase
MMIVAAVGNNALVSRDGPLDAETQKCNVKKAAAALADLARDHQLVITHGNSPQLGLLALQSEALRDGRTYPLDLLGAQSDGMIGYLIEQELGNALPARQVVSLLTQVVVDALDPAFRAPTKPIGPGYTEIQARELARQRGWSVAHDGGNGTWHRVVASPAPRAIVELPTIKLLLEHDVVVICAGGGGIPVVVGHGGDRHGVEAVLDKDLSAALLARQINADMLLMLTDVDHVQARFGTRGARALGKTTPDELRGHEFAAGSMAPKVDAASWFVSTTGRRAAIGSLHDASAIVAGNTGTTITPD